MADVLHKTLPDSELHEPKGVAGAGQGSVYKANGAGSGQWVKIDPTMLAGMNNNGSAGQVLMLDGSGGFSAQQANSYLYGCSVTTPQGSEANQLIVPLRPINNWTQTLSNNVSIVGNRIIFAQGGLYHGTFTVSSFDVTESTDLIRSLLVVDNTSSAIAALANDSQSSTTVSAIFRVNSGEGIHFQKTRTGIQYIPGVLLQYAIHRLGA